MKRKYYLFITLLVLLSIFAVGCGVPQSDYDAVLEENENLKAEIAEMGNTCPPGDFPSLSALNDWLLENDVSEKPATSYAEDWYGRALEVQEDALKDGYIVSADYDYNEEDDTYTVWCIAIINGRVFFWDPEEDEVYEDTSLGTVK